MLTACAKKMGAGCYDCPFNICEEIDSEKKSCYFSIFIVEY